MPALTLGDLRIINKEVCFGPALHIPRDFHAKPIHQSRVNAGYRKPQYDTEDDYLHKIQNYLNQAAKHGKAIIND